MSSRDLAQQAREVARGWVASGGNVQAGYAGMRHLDVDSHGYSALEGTRMEHSVSFPVRAATRRSRGRGRHGDEHALAQAGYPRRRGQGATVVLSAAAGTARAERDRAFRVYVLVVDGLRADEIDPVLTPNLLASRASGTNYPAARSLAVAETIPNHVMMMTGMRPDRTGVPANSVDDRAQRRVRTLDQPADLRAPTVLDRLASAGRFTGSVLSKEYLYGVFGERASVRQEPFPILPITGHVPDLATVDALIAMVDESLVHFAARADLRQLVLATEGVLSAHAPGELRLGPDAGDLVVFCRAGRWFTDPRVWSNPIPGNHGHPATEPIPFFVAGGHSSVRWGVTSAAQARTVDVAPTVGALFGLPVPEGGYDGTARLEVLAP